ncbi:hypothetical protein SASPL_102752 [Salvia splendens]|uniref:SKP1-like protein n=1 Tax=Salvia splendens TaxID=180675 RepID=A0A8X9ACF8_SALSN|nr:SKP1-like protein 1A [Salvia splendens]KAG6437822.1 hypothetical protein SASPL_102752 [Salvia splendens]
MASSSSAKKVVLISNDGKKVEVDEAVAMLSLTVKNLIEDGCIVDGGIPLPKVDSDTLAKLLDYCEYHAPDPWIFCSFQFQAANFLNIEGLLDLMTEAIRDTIAGKTPEEIRQTFRIKNDFTAEEEAVVRDENKWALE